MNFVIYEDMKKYACIYRSVIMKLMGSNNLNYNIIEINKYDKDTSNKLLDIKGNKIYLLDIEVPGKSGIEFAREIRNMGDWISPIIIISSHDEFKSVGYIRKILMFDYISKEEDIFNNLYESLLLAQEILFTKKTFCFKEKGEVFQIPIDDILYIEKSINDNLCIIVTVNNTYKIRSTIQKLESEFADSSNFVRTHRSYLINMRNIKYINFELGEVYFDGDKVAFISRNNKKKLKDKIDSMKVC